LEKFKQKQNNLISLFQVVQTSKINYGLPELLGFKIGQGVGEILMTNGGECLDYWIERINSRKNRLLFMIEMLHQIIPGLELLHA
jgi:hypothetical protein